METFSLKGKTLFITGASRGIGLAIALRAAREGANVAIAAKTVEPNPKLPGTIYTAAQEIEAAGGSALPLQCDIRFEEQVQEAVAKTVAQFGGIDVCINNASAISITPTTQTDMKRYDLMNQINARGTFVCSKATIPHLAKAENPHILNLAPPLDMQARWFKNHVAYTMAKFGMSMCTLGMSAELAEQGIAVNSLWRFATCLAAIRWRACRVSPRSWATQRLPFCTALPENARETSSSTKRCWLRRASPICPRMPTIRSRR